MNPCEQYKECLCEYFDGELDTLRKRDLLRHLEECPNCTQCLNKMRLLKSRLKSLTPIQVSDGFNILLRECIRREASGKRRSIPARPWTRRWVPAVGIALVLIVTGVWILDSREVFRGKPVSGEPNFRELSSPGQVQYVIDDFPSSISISRDESDRPREAYEDTLRLQRDAEVRRRVRTVSF